MPVSFFFDDMPSEVARTPAKKYFTAAEVPSAPEPDPMAKRETLELVRAYYRVEDANVRKRVFELVKALAHASDPERG